jgi:hypothetical protein
MAQTQATERYHQAQQDIERRRLEGQLSSEEANRQLRQLELNETQRYHDFQMQKPPAGTPSADELAQRGAKRTAKINEASALYKKADQLDAEAKKLQGQPDPYGDLAKQMQSYGEESRKLRVQGDAARAEGESIAEPVAPAGNFKVSRDLKGQKWYRSKFKSQYPNADVAAAEQAARAAGADVQP